jgi:beta-phosphoglucomutase family hydrolase
LFDLDGVLTDTARVHAAAWKRMFDDFLRQYGERTGVQFPPFDEVGEYERYVDGKPRYDGVEGFLAARGIRLPRGRRSDGPQRETVCGLGNRKNILVQRLLKQEGPTVFPAARALVTAVRAAGARTAVVSASENCAAVLAAADLADLFDTRVDGLVATRRHLAGKPAPATYLYAASVLGVPPSTAVVVEDAPAGVEAGRAGGFGLVVGVARRASGEQLLAAGADLVVADLSELLDLVR